MLETNQELTSLLLFARIQHLRLTVEELPIGSILVRPERCGGRIESIDDFAKTTLNLSTVSAEEMELESLLGNSADYVLNCLKNHRYGSLGNLTVRTGDGSWISIPIAAAPVIHSFDLSVHLFFSLLQ